MSKKNNLKLNRKYKKICERLEWRVAEDSGTVELEKYSPAGEDFIFAASVENFAKDVELYADNFDIDEHIEMWIEAKRNGVAGVPSTRELVQDAYDIQAMLNELAEALTADLKSTISEVLK